MPRATRTEITILQQELRAMEMLADEIEVAPGDLQRYWDVAADLITLGAEIEEFGVANPTAGADNPAMLELRRRLRIIASTLTELSLD